MFKNTGCPLQPLQCFDGGDTTGAAVKLVKVVSDPCIWGVSDKSDADVILRLNAPTYDQTGTLTAKLNPIYDHSFCTFMIAAMSIGNKFYDVDDLGFENDLNILFGDNKPGVYDISTENKCWPFSCHP